MPVVIAIVSAVGGALVALLFLRQDAPPAGAPPAEAVPNERGKEPTLEEGEPEGMQAAAQDFAPMQVDAGGESEAEAAVTAGRAFNASDVSEGTAQVSPRRVVMPSDFFARADLPGPDTPYVE